MKIHKIQATQISDSFISSRLVTKRDEEQHQSLAEAEEALVPAYPQFPGLLQELGA